MPAFHDVRFPERLSFGALGGPERRTEIVALANGREERNTPWAHSRRRYDAGIGLRSLDDLAEVTAFFEARRGQLHGFRWKDWADHKSCLPSDAPQPTDQVIATGDGARRSFQLVKVYRSGSDTYDRPIRKPVAGTVTLAVAGVPAYEGVHFELDAATGTVTFADPPLAGADVTAGYLFDVPVRFDTDTLLTSVETFSAGQVPDIPVVELKP